MDKCIYINGKFLAERIEGIQRFSIEATKELSKYMKVVLIIPADAKKTIENVDYIEIKCNNGYKFIHFALPKYAKKNKINNVLNFSNIGGLKAPFSVVIHDTLVLDYPKANSFKFNLMTKLFNRLNIYRYKKIYTVSNYSKERILYYYPKIKNDIIVLSSAADQWVDIKPTAVNLPFEGSFYFSLSVIREYKNFIYILNLAKANPSKNFVCTGKQDKISVLGEIPKNVYFTGYLTDEEIKYLYQSCEAFIMPSLAEGFGLPPLEAIVCGCKKIILSDIPVFREIYFCGVNYINISKLYNLDELELKEITSEEREELMSKYSWKNIALKISSSWN